MEVNGKRIAVDIFGDGTSILMIYGFRRACLMSATRRKASSFRVWSGLRSMRAELKGELFIDDIVATWPHVGHTNISSDVVRYSRRTGLHANCRQLS